MAFPMRFIDVYRNLGADRSVAPLMSRVGMPCDLGRGNGSLAQQLIRAEPIASAPEIEPKPPSPFQAATCYSIGQKSFLQL